jgi:hypothetical protein
MAVPRPHVEQSSAARFVSLRDPLVEPFRAKYKQSCRPFAIRRSVELIDDRNRLEPRAAQADHHAASLDGRELLRFSPDPVGDTRRKT